MSIVLHPRVDKGYTCFTVARRRSQRGAGAAPSGIPPTPSTEIFMTITDNSTHKAKHTGSYERIARYVVEKWTAQQFMDPTPEQKAAFCAEVGADLYDRVFERSGFELEMTD